MMLSYPLHFLVFLSMLVPLCLFLASPFFVQHFLCWSSFFFLSPFLLSHVYSSLCRRSSPPSPFILVLCDLSFFPLALLICVVTSLFRVLVFCHALRCPGSRQHPRSFFCIMVAVFFWVDLFLNVSYCESGLSVFCMVGFCMVGCMLLAVRD